MNSNCSRLPVIRLTRSGTEDVKVLAILAPTSADKIDYQPALHHSSYLRMVVKQGKVNFYFSKDGKSFKEGR